MKRAPTLRPRSWKPISIPAALLLFSAIPIAIALVEMVQIPTGTLPADAAHLTPYPIRHFAHVTAGVLFGVLGPLQFGRVLAQRFGWWHRVLGRVFVAAGGVLAVSSLALLWDLPTSSSLMVSLARGGFGAATGVALVLAIAAARRRDIMRHRDWMIRAYALGIGATAVSFVLFPIYVITGQPPTGLASDLIFVGAWVATLIAAEAVIRRQRAA